MNDARVATIEAAIGGPGAPLLAASPGVAAEAAAARAVILVEGASDRVALRTLAARRGRDLRAEGVAVLPTGGATSFGRVLRALVDRVTPVTVAGLVDVGELAHVRRALATVGVTTDDPARHGFFACVDDLEDELIRSLGAERVEAVIAGAGDLPALVSLRKQPAQRDRPETARLRRFLGTTSGRKERYAGLLVGALDLDRVPAPLDAVLDAVPAPAHDDRVGER